MTDPIHKSIDVPLTPNQAFDLFTDKLDKWWPTESHSLSAANGNHPRSVTVEKHVGGHIIEQKSDGKTANWGTITRWQPGKSVGISWYVGRPQNEATDVFVTFTPIDTGTRVDLTHGGFERLGTTAMSLHDNYNNGWNLVFGQCFLGFCAVAIQAQPAQ